MSMTDGLNGTCVGYNRDLCQMCQSLATTIASLNLGALRAVSEEKRTLFSSRRRLGRFGVIPPISTSQGLGRIPSQKRFSIPAAQTRGNTLYKIVGDNSRIGSAMRCAARCKFPIMGTCELLSLHVLGKHVHRPTPSLGGKVSTPHRSTGGDARKASTYLGLKIGRLATIREDRVWKSHC